MGQMIVNFATLIYEEWENLFHLIFVLLVGLGSTLAAYNLIVYFNQLKLPPLKWWPQHAWGKLKHIWKVCKRAVADVWGRYKRRREKIMSGHKHDVFLKSLAADILTDGMDAAMLQGRISSADRYRVWGWLAKGIKLKDLARSKTKPPHPAALKATLRARIAEEFGEDTLNKLKEMKKKKRDRLLKAT